MVGNLRYKIDWVGQIKKNYVTVPFMICFIFYLSAISQYKPPGAFNRGGGRFNGGSSALRVLKGLYLEAFIHVGAYFRNIWV